jgi:hypothetical protein
MQKFVQFGNKKWQVHLSARWKEDKVRDIISADV